MAIRTISRVLARLYQQQNWRWQGDVPTAEEIDKVVTDLITMMDKAKADTAELGRLMVKRDAGGYIILVDFGLIPPLDKQADK